MSILLVAWRQLAFQKLKLAAASAGVIVAVMLMLVQLGIRTGALENTLAFTKRIQADLVLVGPSTDTIGQPAAFPRRLLYRTLGDPNVEAVSVMYIGKADWRNPWNEINTPVSVYGIDPRNTMIELPKYAELSPVLHLMDHYVFDSFGRDTFGPVVEEIDSGNMVEARVAGRRLTIGATMPVGVSIQNDGNIYGTIPNFLRLFPGRNAAAVDIGMIRTRTDGNLEKTKARIEGLVGREARVMTRDELIRSEIRFIRNKTPIDFIFGMGTVVGFFIGCVVVYQILYTEVTNNLPKLATMKAMGFNNRYLTRLVLSQAMILAVLGYIPGFVLAIGLYEVAEQQIQLQFSMTLQRAAGVFVATVLMCIVSALIAVRKAWRADPADVF